MHTNFGDVMPNVLDERANRFPGTYTEYAVFSRKASSRDPNGWKMVGKPTTEHETLREIMMPQSMIDSGLHGARWVDDMTDTEYEILEATVTRTQWRTESQPKKN